MPHEDTDITWFLAQTKPNSHHIAERNLRWQGFHTFLPLQEETRRSRGRFVTQLRPLFPGYLFVAFDVEVGGWRAVNSTHGITRLVGLGKEPKPVPPQLVSTLRLRCDREGRLTPADALAPGDDVMVKKGPFAEFIAKIGSFASERRVWVLLEIMGGATRVAVDAEHLRAI